TLLKSLLQKIPHFRPTISRTAGGISLFVHRRRFNGFAAKVYRLNETAGVAGFNEAVIKADTPTTHVNVYLCPLIVANNLLNPAAYFHGVQASAGFNLGNGPSTSPGNRRSVSTHPRRINANNERTKRLDLFFAGLKHKFGGDERIKVAADECFRA